MMAVYDGYHTEKMRCELYLIIRKVVVFIIVQLNSNSISSTKSAQFEGITLINTLIKNINSQHPIYYF